MGIVREDDAALALDMADTAITAGLKAVEVSFTTPGATDVIHTLRDRHPQVVIGAGTILTPQEVTVAAGAGAQFMVSPGFDPDTLTGAHDKGIPFFPGVLTPTEVATALHAGAWAVKVFPLAAMGSSYLRDLRAPFPDLDIIAVGGMDLERARQALHDGARCVGVGSPIFGAAAGQRRGSDEHIQRVRLAVRTFIEGVGK